MNQQKKSTSPILVTGAHRSGTTWVGKMLTASGEVTYISEPLNLWHRPGILLAPVEHWYTYICAENEQNYLPALRETLGLRYHAWAEIKSLRSRKDIMRMGRDWSAFMWGNLRKRRPLLKDPFAVFSAPWFAERLDCQVVITVRHPAAFVSSLMRLKWPFDFQDLLTQPLLMRDWLEPFRAEMETLLQTPEDVIEQSSLLWRMIYHDVAQYREHVPSLHIVRHEDLSLDPMDGFRSLYASLGLDFTSRAQKTILNASSPENPKEVSRNAIYAVRLDSRSNLQNWKRRLDLDEIARIRQMTEDVAGLYYSDQEWE